MSDKTPRFYLALAAGKLAATALTALGRNGGQIPGKIAETIDPDFLAHIDKPERVVFVTGTNGKTTTSNLLDDLLRYTQGEYPPTSMDSPCRQRGR